MLDEWYDVSGTFMASMKAYVEDVQTLRKRADGKLAEVKTMTEKYEDSFRVYNDQVADLRRREGVLEASNRKYQENLVDLEASVKAAEDSKRDLIAREERLRQQAESFGTGRIYGNQYSLPFYCSRTFFVYLY